MNNYDIEASINAQKEYCKTNSVPNFAPSDGMCWSCHTNIYQLIGTTGISVVKAGREHITSCPHCWRTYCD